MRPIRSWRQGLIDIINWSAVDRGMLPLVLGTPLYFQVILWLEYALRRDDRDLLLNVALGQQVRGVYGGMIVGALLLFALGVRLRKRHPDVVWYQYLTTLYYALTMTYSSWLAGTMSFMTGVVLLGAPVAGFILLERTPVLLAFLTALACTMALSLASALDLLPYAPLVVPPTHQAGELFWMMSAYFLSIIPIVVLILLADRALTSWRRREAGIHAMSRRDPLTGIHNRLGILELLDKEVARTRRHGPPLSVVILDLDHFKSINDTWGHPTGDHVLQVAAELLQRTIRQCDVVGRFGGEEFLLLLPDTTLEGARVLADRCRQRLAEEKVRAENGEHFHVTGSFGLVCNEQCLDMGPSVLIKTADEALCRAQQGGRNRVEAVAPSSPGSAT